MQVEVQRKTITKEVIEVQLPYYFEQDCGGDSFDAMRYGKIEAKRTTLFCLSRNHGAKTESVEMEINDCPPSAMQSYLADEYKSTEEYYLHAKRQALEVISGA